MYKYIYLNTNNNGKYSFSYVYDLENYICKLCNFKTLKLCLKINYDNLNIEILKGIFDNSVDVINSKDALNNSYISKIYDKNRYFILSHDAIFRGAVPNELHLFYIISLAFFLNDKYYMRGYIELSPQDTTYSVFSANSDEEAIKLFELRKNIE